MATQIQSRTNTYQVEGPFGSLDYLFNASGVYIISTINKITGKHDVLDIGESDDVKVRLRNHDRTNQWQALMQNGLYAGIIYCNEQVRMAVERDLRLAINPPCGIR